MITGFRELENEDCGFSFVLLLSGGIGVLWVLRFGVWGLEAYWFQEGGTGLDKHAMISAALNCCETQVALFLFLFSVGI